MHFIIAKDKTVQHQNDFYFIRNIISWTIQSLIVACVTLVFNHLTENKT